jgi:hypothetical protein
MNLIKLVVTWTLSSPVQHMTIQIRSFWQLESSLHILTSFWEAHLKVAIRAPTLTFKFQSSRCSLLVPVLVAQWVLVGALDATLQVFFHRNTFKFKCWAAGALAVCVLPRFLVENQVLQSHYKPRCKSLVLIT